jgi:DNA-binding LytR/AlgR family response regulator
VVDYLLKPVSLERFLKACNKAKELFDLRNDRTVLQKEEPDHLFVNVEYKLVKIQFSEILFIEALKDYIKIHLAPPAKPVLTKMSLKTMEEKLPVNKFVRIHKSYIVSAGKVTVIKRDLINVGDLELPVSDFYKENLMRIANK